MSSMRDTLATSLMSTRFTDYDPFAWLFNHYWGTEFHAQVMPVLERLVLRLLPSKASILDLCCGDGRVASSLHDRGFQVTGLDGSERMLEYARERVPQASFILGDARHFDLPPSFHAVISTFDSLNHIMGKRSLQQVFANAANALHPGGYLAFDLNREQGYTELWVEMTGMVEDGAVSVARSDYDQKRGIATCRITSFEREHDVWTRSDFTLKQRYHPHEEVMAALRRAGFSDIASFDADNDLHMRGRIGQHRTFYLARKPLLIDR
jgi:SAM-dependent methyltransferase